MTVGIMPESDRKREGSLSVLAPRRQTQCDSHSKRSVRRESPWGPPDLPPPPFLEEGRRLQGSPKKQPKMKHKRESNPARRRKS